MYGSSQQPVSPWPHRLAVALVCATFPLVWIGGLVTTHDAGMAVPDWPNTYGYNLFLYPLDGWLAVWDIFLEHTHRLIAASVGLATIVLAVMLWRSDPRKWIRWLGVAAVLGVAASVSSASAPDRLGEGHRLITRIADFDDFLSVMAGAVAVAAVGATGWEHGLIRFGEVVAVGLLAGVAGWLLFERAHSVAERGVFVIGTLALVGGAAVYVNGSPLLAGMVAGICWKRLPGRADRIVRNDVSRFQHPLVILLLMVAGAMVELTPLAIWLLAPFVVFRLAGKVIGAWAAAWLVPPLRAGDLAAYLLAPGLLGIGLALNFVQVSSTEVAAAVASAVALGTLASEVLALMAAPGAARER